MPTANLEMRQHEITVPPGVYASRITVKGALHLSLTNIGTRPTVDDLPHLTVETHILDFDQDIYGEEVTLEIYRFLRCVQKFSVLDQVKEQVQRDILETRRYFGLGLPGAG
jgi:FAD synthase